MQREGIWSCGDTAPLTLNLDTQYGGQLHTPAVLPPGEDFTVRTEHEAGWASEVV